MIGELMALAIGMAAGQEAPAIVSDYAQQRQRLSALIANGDCDGAHGAVFVLADRKMLEWVEGVCPMGSRDLARWDTYNPDQFEGMFTEAQVRTAHAIMRGEEPPVSDEPYDPNDLPEGD